MAARRKKTLGALKGEDASRIGGFTIKALEGFKQNRGNALRIRRPPPLPPPPNLLRNLRKRGKRLKNRWLLKNPLRSLRKRRKRLKDRRFPIKPIKELKKKGGAPQE